MDTIERVRALIRLAADERTPIEEARTAALTAVRLIVRERVELVAAHASRAKPVALDDLLNVAVDEANESLRRWPEAGPTPKGRPRARPASTPKPSILRAKSAGFCAMCGDTYAQGDRVVWLPETREIVHVECNAGRGRRPDIR